MRHVINLTFKPVLLLLLSGSSLFADNLLHLGGPILDRPTLTTLGIQLPITGADNFNASVTVHYRATGTLPWLTALPLFRVHPETVLNYPATPQFSGSIFDLKPATAYDIQLHAVDPDGLDQTLNLNATTRPVPGNPALPVNVSVSDAISLQNALNAAVPGTVITLANGVYSGIFDIYTGGTAANPIVIRGASQAGVIVDGGNCTGCNVIEAYGAGYLHIESLTIQNAERAIRFQTSGAIGNVVRRVHIKNTTLGIAGRGTQYDFYIADNILEGQLLWPHIYTDDNGAESDQDGISVTGFGHVVAHNQISGYGDAMKTVLEGARANDFYGNDVLFTYDNGIELDGSEGNTRAFRNRFTNTYEPLSVQPIHGGPAYLFRNVVVNPAGEQLKFHAEGSPYSEPSGVLVYNNTFVSPPTLALTMQTVVTSHYFAIENNLFIAAPSVGQQVVQWLGINDHGLFDYNGYFPDGFFEYHNPGGYLDTSNFAGLAGTGYETHGLLANGPLFANGLTGPPSYAAQLAPTDVSLAPGSVVLDKGLLLPNINSNYTGSGPDLGALELGCPEPSYGPRAAGVDESNEVTGCGGAPVAPPPVTSLTVTPPLVTLPATGTQRFTAATVPPGGAVSWQISSGFGSVDATGLYTAPANAPHDEIGIVTAVSATNAAVSGSATVHVSVPPGITVAPLSVTLGPGGQQSFSATVTGELNNAVAWRLTPWVGTIDGKGHYTAPASIAAAQQVIVTATIGADRSHTASAVVSLTPAAALQ